MKLWIDDERPPLSEFTTNAQSSAQAINVLSRAKEAGERVELISFDHDLDGYIGKDTAIPVMQWIIDNEFWPDEMRFHTANPSGHIKLVTMAMDNAPVTTIIDDLDPWHHSVFDLPELPGWVDELLRRM
jgi:hypothetical protein